MSSPYIAMMAKSLLPSPSEGHSRQIDLAGVLTQQTPTATIGMTGTQPQFKLLERTNMIEEFIAAAIEYDDDYLVYGNGDHLEGFTFISLESIDSARWEEIMWSIFEQDGRYLAVEWRRGLTEMQENDISFDKFSVFEVVPYDKIVIDYKRVPVKDVA